MYLLYWNYDRCIYCELTVYIYIYIWYWVILKLEVMVFFQRLSGFSTCHGQLLGEKSLGFRWKSGRKKGPWLFKVYRGWDTTQLCGDFNKLLQGSLFIYPKNPGFQIGSHLFAQRFVAKCCVKGSTCCQDCCVKFAIHNIGCDSSAHDHLVWSEGWTKLMVLAQKEWP